MGVSADGDRQIYGGDVCHRHTIVCVGHRGPDVLLNAQHHIATVPLGDRTQIAAIHGPQHDGVCLIAGPRGAKYPDCKLEPYEQEDDRHDDGASDAGCGMAEVGDGCVIQGQAGEDEATSEDKVTCAPLHRRGELHGNEWDTHDDGGDGQDAPEWDGWHVESLVGREKKSTKHSNVLG